MDFKTKERKQELAIELEDEDQAVDVAQMAPGFQAAGSAQVGGSTQENPHPPTLAEMTANPKEFRRYVSFLANNTPQPPPNLYGDDIKKWQESKLLTATLNHLREVFKDKVKPREEAYRFYQDWLTVNVTDYPGSPFISRASAYSLFKSESFLRCKFWKMAGVGQQSVGKKKKVNKTEEEEEEEEEAEEANEESGEEGIEAEEAVYQWKGDNEAEDA